MVGGGASSIVEEDVLLRPQSPPPAAPQVSVPAVQFPASAAVLREAARPARLAQPARLAELVRAPHLRFNLGAVSPQPPDGAKSPFAVTSLAGILYVARPQLLDPNTTIYTVTVRWAVVGRSQMGGQAQVQVELLEGASQACQDGRRGKSCSSRESAAACNSYCGQGAGAALNATNHLHEDESAPPRREHSPLGGCAWRDIATNSTSRPTVHYATCTPDVDTCPDKLCDPLEDAYPALCPQDCAREVYGGSKNEPSWRGLFSCQGLGKCESQGSHCKCSPYGALEDAPGGRKTTTGTSSVSASSEAPEPLVSGPAPARTTCGPVCVLSVVAGSALLLSAATLLVYWRYRLYRRAQRERKLAPMGGEAGPRSWAPDSRLLQPELKLPVDPQWEFPRSRLIVEKTLGEGEFGRVMRATAIDIAGVPGATTVAVKTLKDGAGQPELCALLSEAELLKGVRHPNVVRLLGVCAAPGGPPLLVIEFAEHGSLRNYLRKTRHLETNSGPVTQLTPQDVLSFAWQIAKGMAYLSEMKLVHRDLAARNVLVATGAVCKISDFGLTRDVYEDDAYLKKSKGRVPVKWMAPESLADHVYTSKSDVWSFGVLLWELVTLGASPYPGVAVHKLFSLLRAGYRMECPGNCSPTLYKVMRRCWQDEPFERPSFKELTYIFEKMLADAVEYLNLDALVVQNYAYFSESTTLQEKLSMDDSGFGNLLMVPLDPTSDSMTPTDSWQQTDFREELFDAAVEKADSCSPASAVGNSYLSPIHVVRSAPRPSPYMNMVGSTERRRLQQEPVFSSGASTPCSSSVATP